MVALFEVHRSSLRSGNQSNHIHEKSLARQLSQMSVDVWSHGQISNVWYNFESSIERLMDILQYNLSCRGLEKLYFSILSKLKHCIRCNFM